MLIVPSLIGISFITFSIMQLMPGSPVLLRLQKMQGMMAGNSVPEEVIEQTKKLYGLDKPIWKQYVLWVGRLCTLDFGTSFKDRRPVLDKILEALPVTLQLNIISIFIIYVISLPLGVYSATHQRTWSDTIITVLLFVLYSLPNFWVAMLLIFFLSGAGYLSWFPVSGLRSTDYEQMSWTQTVIDRLWHLVLPIVCYTYDGFAALSRYGRAAVIENLRQDYVRTARAYGFTEKVVIFRYTVRNSLIPIITLLGTLLPSLIAGSVIIENVFTIPGIGRLSFESILNRDYPTVMGILTITAILTLAGLIVSDILYALADPRIKLK
jgi:peptide/nickel transport system permease protein